MDMMKSELGGAGNSTLGNNHQLSKLTDNNGTMGGLMGDFDPHHPSIIEELLQQEHEWMNIQEVVKLTFKAVNQVLYQHNAIISEMQAVLPAKANKSDVHQLIIYMMNGKANLIDVKKTMAEVAANIEQRVTYDDARRMLEEKVARSDLHFLLQNKPTFDDIKNSWIEKYHN